MFRPTSLNVTTGLLIAAALYVVYVRIKGWLDSSVPLLYYAAMSFYTNTVDTALAPSVVYSGFGLALLLRFEFLNSPLMRIIQALELVVLAVILFSCIGMILWS